MANTLGVGRVYVEDEKQLEYIDGIERFYDLLERKIGRDAVDYLKEFLDDFQQKKIDNGICVGECDALYKQQEHYETAIKDALEIIDERFNRHPKRKKKADFSTWSATDFFYKIEEILNGAL